MSGDLGNHQRGQNPKVLGMPLELLRKIFPPHVVEMLRTNVVVPPEMFKNVSVLFADVESYTTIASRCTPLQTHSLLHDLYNTIDTLLSRFPRLYKVETIGDGTVTKLASASLHVVRSHASLT